MAGLSIDDFLGHSGNDYAKTTYLRDWKKKAGYANTFIHKRAPIHAVWRHQIPKIVTITRDGREVREVWLDNPVCHESEEILKKQNRRDTSGGRDYPPESCGICLLGEHLREGVRDGSLDWREELFEFEGDDPNKRQVIHVGGFFGAFGGDLSPEEKKELNDAGIYQKEAWKETANAKLNYIFSVVDADNTKSGVQVAIEPALLGDKVKIVIRDAIRSKGEDKGDPRRSPFCIRWEYYPNEIDFKKKYHALPWERQPLTREIANLISSEETIPNVSKDIKPYDLLQMGAYLEKHCILPKAKGIPWEDLFDRKKGKGVAVPADLETPPAPPEEEDTSGMVACDNPKCRKPIRLEDTECKHCGAKYEIQEDEPPPPPPAPVYPSRSDAKKAKAAASAAPAKAPPPPPAPKGKATPSPFTESDNDIPFLTTTRVIVLTTTPPLRRGFAVCSGIIWGYGSQTP